MNDMSHSFSTAPEAKDLDGALDSPRKELRLGALFGGLFFVGLLGFAAITPLDAGALAAGAVAVSGNRQAVQHPDGGVVTQLAVQEGTQVRKGQILLKVSATDIVAAERGLTSEIIMLLAQKARLQAERDGAGAMATPLEFSTYLAADRQLIDDAMRSQRLLFDARRYSMATERGVMGQRIAQHNRQIGGYGYQMTSNRTQRTLIGDELDGLRIMEERGFVAKNRLRATERAAAQLDGDFGALQSDVARLNEAIGETQLQVVSIDREKMEEVAVQLRDVQIRLDELQPRLIAAREKLDKSVIRAPANGRVVGLTIFTVGGVVSPGELLMEIVPDDKSLIVEARANPADADDLSAGMATQVRFSGVQERSLPILEGAIRKISADSFEDERTGAPYFRVEVEVPQSEIAKLERLRGEHPLKAGMPAEVMIPLRKRTALDYIIEPLTQTLWKSGREQ